MTDQITLTEQMPSESLENIQGILSKKRPERQYHSIYEMIFALCEIIGKEAHIDFKEPGSHTTDENPLLHLNAIVKASKIRMRKVKLTKEWWKYDNGALFAFYQETPCALIPLRHGGYKVIDVINHKSFRVTTNNAKHIAYSAFFFYRSFPQTIKKIKSVFKFSIAGQLRPLGKFLGIQAMLGVLGLIIPIVTGGLFDTVVPNADYHLLFQLTIVLVINTVVVMLLGISQFITLLRMEFKIEINLQSAIWDRLLKLPMTFYNKFTAGDLAFRAGTISDIQNILTGSVITTVLGGFMSVITLGLMFYLDMRLAFAALGMVLVISAATIWVTILNLKWERKSYHHYGKMNGLVLQLLTGISKLRVANAQSRAFSVWSKVFTAYTGADYRADYYLVRFSIFNVAVSVINTIILYGLVILRGESISFGTFIIFNAAFSQFFGAMLAMTRVVTDALDIIPLYEKNKPILEAELENPDVCCDPGELDGRISIRQVTFGYHKDTNPIFKNFSLEIENEKFIALVGPSGSGKSTLFRLLLGFEVPQSGGIFYNGINLTTLDKPAVRDQIGVVLQHSSLLPGTILDNIIGNDNTLTREDAWAIAEKVGIAQLIHELPMGMDTLVIEGMNTLSGGEAQRLMLARALAKKPKILFLDEATSALDNRTQALVHEHLLKLKSTQVVVAHRLSTVIHADKIHVIDNGQIAESGTYDELVKLNGLFAQLAKRQQLK